MGYGTNQFPAFFTQDSGLKAQLRRDTPQDVAALIHESRALELPNGLVIAVPNPNPVPTAVIDNAIEVRSLVCSCCIVNGQWQSPSSGTMVVH